MSVAFDAMYVMVGFWGAMVGLVQGSVFVVGYGLLEACIQVALGSRNALPSKESARALPELESKTGVDKEDQKDFDDNFQLAAGAIVAENGNHVQDAEEELLEQAAVAPEQTEGDEEGEQYDMEPATRALVFVDDEIEEFFEESRPLEAVEEAEELAGVSEDAADVAADVNDAVADVEEDTTQQDTEDSTTAPEGFCKVMFDSAGVATVVMLPQPVAETFAAAEVDDMPEAEPTVVAEAGSDAEMVSKVYFGNSGSAHVMLLPMPPKLGEDEEQVEEMEEKEQIVEEVAMQPNESRSLHVNGTVEALPLPMVRALSEPDLGPARKEGDLKLADKVADVLEVLEDAIPADKKSMLDTAYNEDVHAVDGTASSGSVQQEVEAGEEKEGQVEELDGGLRQAPREEPVSAPTKAKKGAFFGLACCMVRPSRVRD